VQEEEYDITLRNNSRTPKATHRNGAIALATHSLKPKRKYGVAARFFGHSFCPHTYSHCICFLRKAKSQTENAVLRTQKLRQKKAV
jgi:hypothetical protein